MDIIEQYEQEAYESGKDICPYDQGYLSAKGDFGWCSLQVRRGIKEYFCADCKYTKMRGKYIQHAEAWRKGYGAYFAKQNKKPRKKQIFLPIFE